MNSSTGFVFHELCLWHNTGNAAGFFEPNLTVEPDSHAESPATKRRIRNLLDVSGLLDQLKIIKPKPATEAQSEFEPRSCRQQQNIRLSSAAANPLSRSRNQRADEDG